MGLLSGNPARLRRVGGLLREATLRLWRTPESTLTLGLAVATTTVARHHPVIPAWF